MFRTLILKENYKEIAKITGRSTDNYRIMWDRVDVDENYCECMEENYNYKPELDTIKSLILGYYNTKTNKEIVEGMIYETDDHLELHPYLSNENQMNYKVAYDLQKVPYKVKNQNGYEPTYHTFQNMTTYGAFYRACVNHINTKLQEAWEIKDGIDWNKYDVSEEQLSKELGEMMGNSCIIEEDTSLYNVTENNNGNVDVQA